ncbi:MAG: acyltransferase [Solirubrobacteraceae bacterium]|nr:acyltransferase [Solirubrobacteraceae bacterium]
MALLAIAALAAAVAVAMSASGASTPRCFGAAARDLKHPCHNASLALRVVPTPFDAVITPNAPCIPAPGHSIPHRCTFGARLTKARGTIALIGDSHAGHWRGALIGVAAHYGWHGVSITRSGCPLSLATPLLPHTARAQCKTWREQVYTWMGQHPEIRTVFVSEHPGPVIVPKGAGGLATKMRGYLAAWRRLPPSVKHIVVIRDTPINKTQTVPCIDRAMRNHEDAGTVCSIPVGGSLKVDPAALAGVRYHPRRVRVADLTHFFCDTRCYPVVGGVLVHKDIDHLTALYSGTLGPYLLRQVEGFGIRQ